MNDKTKESTLTGLETLEKLANGLLEMVEDKREFGLMDEYQRCKPLEKKADACIREIERMREVIANSTTLDAKGKARNRSGMN